MGDRAEEERAEVGGRRRTGRRWGAGRWDEERVAMGGRKMGPSGVDGPPDRNNLDRIRIFTGATTRFCRRGGRPCGGRSSLQIEDVLPSDVIPERRSNRPGHRQASPVIPYYGIKEWKKLGDASVRPQVVWALSRLEIMTTGASSYVYVCYSRVCETIPP